jgi:hypothetical protein
MYLLSMYCGRWSTLVSCYSDVRIQCTFVYVLWSLVDPFYVLWSLFVYSGVRVTLSLVLCVCFVDVVCV